MVYITEQGEKEIKAFRYKGKNISYSYNYLWSPFAQMLLKFTPPTIAPNTLTLIGFLMHTIATIILCLQGEFSSEAPRWSLLLYSFCVFCYQHLDNVDGKQARKIQNSTPLGMIMDHGCDALGVICLTAGMARVVCIDHPYFFIWTYIMVQFSFYVTAWCQYWSNGYMVLGTVNGVDDGIPIIWASAFLCGIFGQSVFKTSVTIFGQSYPLNQIIATAILISSFFQIYSIMFQCGQQFTKDVKRALKDLIHAVLLIVTLGVICLVGGFLPQYIVGVSIGLSFTMARNVSYILVCSTGKMEFKQYSPPVVLFISAYLIYCFFLKNLFSPGYVVYGVAVFAVYEYFKFVVSICSHIADILRIPIFSVFKPQENKQ